MGSALALWRNLWDCARTAPPRSWRRGLTQPAEPKRIRESTRVGQCHEVGDLGRRLPFGVAGPGRDQELVPGPYVMPDASRIQNVGTPLDQVTEDIDFMGHVNNANYLSWVQDAVVAHWQKIAPSQAVTEHLWVALKHEITYRKPAFLNDEVFAEVILQKVHGARAFYDTVIKRGEEGLADAIGIGIPLPTVGK